VHELGSSSVIIAPVAISSSCHDTVTLIFSCRTLPADSLELAARLSLWSVAFRRSLKTSLFPLY